jgi:SpoVK/Ycf46/Vps4 family AAA+-type ATPase
MARKDLLLKLVQAGASGDKTGVRKTVEAMIADEKARQHNGLANSLTQALANSANTSPSVVVAGPVPKGRDYLLEKTPHRELADIVLSEANQSRISEFIFEQQRADTLRAHGLEPRHRLLFTGPPGNGKTSLAEAIANALGVGFFVVRYDLLIGSYLGETATRLRRTLDYARTTPCVLFFDEFDAIGKERGDRHETGEIKRVVSSLLMQIDELPSYTVLVGATNHPELLDRAAWRRFQIHIELEPPLQKDVAAYIERFSKDIVEPLGYTPAALAKSLGKVSYSDLEEFCLDIRRAYVLTMGQNPLKSVVKSKLDSRAQRRKSRKAPEKA